MGKAVQKYGQPGTLASMPIWIAEGRIDGLPAAEGRDMRLFDGSGYPLTRDTMEAMYGLQQTSKACLD